MTEREFTKNLDWPGYRVYGHEIDEQERTPKLWVRRKRGNRVPACSGCGGRCTKIEEVRQREVRDRPWRKYQTIVVVEFYRVRCPKCGLKMAAVPQLPSKAPFSKDFEDAVAMLAVTGHMSRAMLERYGHIRMNAKREVVRALSTTEREVAGMVPSPDLASDGAVQ